MEDGNSYFDFLLLSVFLLFDIFHVLYLEPKINKTKISHPSSIHTDVSFLLNLIQMVCNIQLSLGHILA